MFNFQYLYNYDYIIFGFKNDRNPFSRIYANSQNDKKVL